jgi:hypothetical protein
MREIKVTVPSTATVTAPVVLDQYIAPFQVSYVKTGSGTVQVSQTDPFPYENLNFTAPTFTWITAPTDAPNTATFLAQPYRAIRLSGATAGDTLTVVQSGVK